MSTFLLAPSLLAPLRLVLQLSLLSGRPLVEVARSGDRLDQRRRARGASARGDEGARGEEPAATPAPAPSAEEPGDGELERRIRAAAAELPRRRQRGEGAPAPTPGPAARPGAPLPRRERPAVPAIVAAAAAGPLDAPAPATPPPQRWAAEVRRCLEARPDEVLAESAPRIERLVGRRSSVAYRAAADVLEALRAEVPAERLTAFVADLRRRHPRKRALHAVLDERGLAAG